MDGAENEGRPSVVRVVIKGGFHSKLWDFCRRSPDSPIALMHVECKSYVSDMRPHLPLDLKTVKNFTRLEVQVPSELPTQVEHTSFFNCISLTHNKPLTLQHALMDSLGRLLAFIFSFVQPSKATFTPNPAYSCATVHNWN